VDSRRARQHVAHKPLVPGHVHESESHARFFQKREAQVDRDSPALFFLKPVRMRARQRFDQRGFPVVDVPRRSDNDALGCGHFFCAENSEMCAFRCYRTAKGRVKLRKGEMRNYRAKAISSTIACAAARGSVAVRIGLPTTM